MPTSTGFRQHSFLRVLLVLVASAHCLLLVQGFQTFLPTRTRATSSFSLSVHRPSANSDNDRRSLLTDALKTAGLVGMAWGTAATALPGGANAAAKKIINLEEARELGEKKMIEIEKAKGPLIKVRDNVKYREELTGKGPTFEQGDLVKVRYQVYKGNGDYMFSTGYGREFQDDVGDTYDFTFGRPNSIPKGVEIGMEGMRVGGKRKISVPPELGWQTSGGFPAPETFAGKRKLLNHQNEFLQFEVELIRVRPKGGGGKGNKGPPEPEGVMSSEAGGDAKKV